MSDIETAFQGSYCSWEFPTETLDKKLNAMPDDVRQIHFRRIREILEDKDFQMEVDEWKRELYHRLALGKVTEEERRGLQFALLSVESFQKRLTEIGSRVATKPLRSLRESL